MLYFALTILVLIQFFVYPLRSDIPVYVSARVDTSNDDIKDIVTQWVAYLQSRPDTSSYKNPCSDLAYPSIISPDIYKAWIFQSADMVLKYRPHILSVVPQDRYPHRVYMVATQFAGIDSDGFVRNLGILNVVFRRCSKGWNIENTVLHRTERFDSRKVSGVTFLYPETHRFNTQRAMQAIGFADSLAVVFGLSGMKGWHYVITSNPDQLAWVLGLDHFVFPPPGLVYPENKLLLTAMSTEFHKHEVVHTVFANYPHAHPFFMEGVATYFGGSLHQNFSQLVAMLRARLESGEDLRLQNIMENFLQDSESYYTVAAVMAKIVLDAKGPEAMKELLGMKLKDMDLIPMLAVTLGVETRELDAIWMARVHDISLATR